MPDNKEQFKHEALLERDAIAKYLSALADGVARGSIVLSQGDRRLELTPRGLLHATLDAKRAERRSRVILRFSWREDHDDPRPGPPLEITSANE